MKIASNLDPEDPKNDKKCLKMDFLYILESLCRYANMENRELQTTTYDFWTKKPENGRFQENIVYSSLQSSEIVYFGQ